MAHLHEIEQLKTIGDVTAISVMLGSMTDMLPAVAAIVTIVWSGIRIYETQTIQRLLGNRPTDTKEDKN